MGVEIEGEDDEDGEWSTSVIVNKKEDKINECEIFYGNIFLSYFGIKIRFSIKKRSGFLVVSTKGRVKSDSEWW